jgi:hypothetical protein
MSNGRSLSLHFSRRSWRYDGVKSDPSSRFEPPEDWIDALTIQCIPAMFKRLQRYAARRMRGIDKIGYAADEYAAEELVQDALHDTATGVLRWDPAARSLEQHLLDVLQARTKRLRRQAERFPLTSLDGERRGDELAPRDEVDAALLEQALRAETAMHAATVMTELRQLAGDDDLLLRMLDALERGAVTRDDVIHVAQFSRVEYHNARRRLDRLVTQLPSSLAVRDAASSKPAAGDRAAHPGHDEHEAAKEVDHVN